MKQEIVWDIVTTDGCNLDCSYCFARAKSLKDSKSIDKGTFEDLALFLEKDTEHKHFLKLYGGEPLLNKDIWGFLDRISKISHKENFRVVIITNGVLLKNFKSELEKYSKLFPNFSLTISIDGIKKIHDSYRVFKGSNAPSHDLVIKNILEVAKSIEGDISVQSVLSPLFLNWSDENLEFFHNLIEGTNISWNFVPMNDNAFDNVTTKEIDEIFEKFSNGCKKYIENFANGKFSAFQFWRCTKMSEYDPNQLSWCGAGSNYFSVTPNGDIYPCSHYYHNKASKKNILGNIKGLNSIEDITKSMYLNAQKHSSKCKFCNYGLVTDSESRCLGQCLAVMLDTKRPTVNPKICRYNYHVSKLGKEIMEGRRKINERRS